MLSLGLRSANVKQKKNVLYPPPATSTLFFAVLLPCKEVMEPSWYLILAVKVVSVAICSSLKF